MRAFVFLLVLANLVFFAWAQGYFGQAESPDAVRLGQQIAPERLQIRSRGEAPEAAAQPPAAAASADAPATEVAAAAQVPAPATQSAVPVNTAAVPVPEKCVAWSRLAAADADALEAALANERFAALRRQRRTVPETTSWWVFIPPLTTKAEAEKKAGEVRRLGITEYFVVQDPGPNRYAISLGIFSSEQAAEGHLAVLRGKGVRSAKVGSRAAREASVTIEASGPESLLDAVGEAVRSALPDVKAGACVKG